MDERHGVFSGVPKRALDQAFQVFQRMDVDAGVQLIEEGEVDPTVVVVDTGELAITTGGTLLGRASSGDVLGEIALFGNGIRSASVTSAVPSRLWVLDRHGYDWLRAKHNPVATALEENALHYLTDRLRSVGTRIASIAEGEEEDAVTPDPGFFDRVASVFGGGGLANPGRVDRVAALGHSRLFKGVTDEVLGQVAEYLNPCAARTGHFLCTEGDVGQEMFLLVSGSVEVIVSTQTGRMEHLATLKAGDAFGMCALLQVSQPRMASCVARERSVLLSLDRMTFAELVPRNDFVGSVFRVALIRALARQLPYANAQLGELDENRARHDAADAQYEAVMRAAAALEANGEYLGSVEGGITYF